MSLFSSSSQKSRQANYATLYKNPQDHHLILKWVHSSSPSHLRTKTNPASVMHSVEVRAQNFSLVGGGEGGGWTKPEAMYYVIKIGP